MTERTLWRYDEVFRLVVTSTASVLLLLLAYIGASGTARLKEQGLWLDLAIGALLLGGFGATSFLLAGFRRVYLGVGDLLRAGEVPTALGSTEAVGPSEGPEGSGAAALVSVAGTSRFHRVGCVLTNGKAVVAGGVAAHVRAGRRSCEMCRP